MSSFSVRSQTSQNQIGKIQDLRLGKLRNTGLAHEIPAYPVSGWRRPAWGWSSCPLRPDRSEPTETDQLSLGAGPADGSEV